MGRKGLDTGKLCRIGKTLVDKGRDLKEDVKIYSEPNDEHAWISEWRKDNSTAFNYHKGECQQCKRECLLK